MSTIHVNHSSYLRVVDLRHGRREKQGECFRLESFLALCSVLTDPCAINTILVALLGVMYS